MKTPGDRSSSSEAPTGARQGEGPVTALPGRGRDHEVPPYEAISALKHDLAKYVAWRSANYDDAAWQGPLSAELAAALRADLLTTHGERAAWDVWDHHTADWPRPLGDPRLVAVEAAVDELRRLEPALRQGDVHAIAAARPRIRAAQTSIREALRVLHRELLARAGGSSSRRIPG